MNLKENMKRFGTKNLKEQRSLDVIANKIKNVDIADYLSLPPVKIHCSVLAEDAIKAAIEDYKKKSF